jgi:hypothetical protein
MTAEILDSEGIEALKKASESKVKLSEAGISNIIEEKPEAPKDSYETFLTIEGLPSKGMFYNSPIKGQALKVEDILLLSNFDEDNYQDKFNEVFLRRIMGAKPREILTCDELFLAFWLRESSFPNIGFPGEGHVCKHCKFENPEGTVTFGLKNMSFEIKDFGKKMAEFKAGNGKVTITLPITKKEYKISLSKRGHTDRYREVIKRDYTQNGIKAPDDIVAVLPLASVLNVGDEDIRDVVTGIKSLPSLDFVYLTKQVMKYSLAPIPEVSMPCLNCKEVTPIIGYTFPVNFYFPIDQL